MTLIGTIVRFVVSAIVLMVVGMLVPGFSRMTFASALLAALVIAAIGWVLEMLFGRRISGFGRGIIGFLTGVAVIYLTQWFVPGMRVTLIGAILAALVIGLIDLFIPGDVSGNLFRGGTRARVDRREDD
jgi:putative membrane protein